jgi:tetratricopeptide (TPR) repeat protein
LRRAFLSHSSDDSEFVRQVASILGPYKTQIDTKSFRPGEDFRTEIARVLDDSDTFVFFASKKSLSSFWCRFEIDEAEMRRVRRTLRKSLVLVIDEEVALEDIPAWLRRGRIVRFMSPALAARKVEGILLAPDRDQRPFLGRNEDIQRGVRKLSASQPPSRILVATGLDGIGRRTYLDHLVSDALDLELGPRIILSDTATVEDLFLECKLLTAALLSRQELESELRSFRALSVDEQAGEIALQLTHIVSQGNTPCIIDHNSMLDNNSEYLDVYQRAISRFLDESDGLLCLVHGRVPYLTKASFRQFVLERKLRALSAPDSRALVSRLLSEMGLRISAEESEQLAEQVAGYPPAAYYVAAQIEDYGLDIVLSDLTKVGDFHEGSFLRYIEGLKISTAAREILTYLSFETQLPLAGIAAATGLPLEDASGVIVELIDHNLVEMSNDEYLVAAPIQATILRRRAGNLDASWYADAFARLEEEYWTDDRSPPPISVVDATLRAGFRIGRNRFAGYGELVRPSLLISAAQEKYHQRDYERALDYVERAQQMAAPTTALLEVKIKSLAQLQKFGPARGALREYQEFGESRKWYLDGFIERRSGQHDRASERFQRAYAAGERSISLLRDYADSLLKCGDAEQASGIAEEALRRDKGDIFLLDLMARIAIAAKSETEAEEALNALEEVDRDKRFILQRRAWYLIQRRGTAEAGRQAARLAEQVCRRRDAPIEAFIAWARGLIIAREFGAARDVEGQIKKKKTSDSQRILAELDCRTAIEKGEWRRAEQSLQRISTSTRTFDSLRSRILEQKARDPTVLLDDRESARRQAERLQHEPEVFDASPETFVSYE